MKPNNLLAAFAAASLSTLALAQDGSQSLNLDMEAQTGSNLGLGVAVSGGEIFTSHRGNGATTTGPHTIYVYDATGALTRQFPQPAASNATVWGYRDGATDNNGAIFFGWDGGIDVMDANGNAVTSVQAANGPQTVASPIVSTGSLGSTTHRAIAYDPAGNGGNGSLFVGNFASAVEEIALDGTLLHSYPQDGVWSLYGLAYDPIAGTLWMNSAPNAGPLAEYAIDRSTDTLTATGRSIERSQAGTAQGGLDLVLGGLDGRDCGYDLIGVDQGTPDSAYGYRVEMWTGYAGAADLLAGFDGGNFTTSTAAVPLSAATVDLDISAAGQTYWAFLDVGDPARPQGPILGYKSLWQLTFPRTNSTAFGPLTGGTPLSIPAAAFLATAPGATVNWQAVTLDPAVPVGTCGLRLPLGVTNITSHENLGPTPTRVQAQGSNSFNSATTSGFFSITAGDNTAGNPIVQVTLDWVGSSNPAQSTMVFDLDQTGMANTFNEGNGGGCSGTYRNGSDAATGLDYTNINNNVLSGTCAGSIAHCQGDSANSSRTLTWYFTGGSFTNGASIEFDIDTDGGAGITGAAMAGLVATITLQDGTVLSGELTVDAGQAQTAAINF